MVKVTLNTTDFCINYIKPSQFAHLLTQTVGTSSALVTQRVRRVGMLSLVATLWEASVAKQVVVASVMAVQLCVSLECTDTYTADEK